MCIVYLLKKVLPVAATEVAHPAAALQADMAGQAAEAAAAAGVVTRSKCPK